MHVTLASALAAAVALFSVAPQLLLVVSQEMGADFAIGLGLLGGFRRVSFAVDFADLGKRRRVVAFGAGSACEIVQKLQTGFACGEGVVS